MYFNCNTELYIICHHEIQAANAACAGCRAKPGSVIHDPAVVVARAVRMVRDREVVALDGSVVRLEADTICLHGDTPGAADLARAVRAGLESAGVAVRGLKA